jgi:hypothetical protein
MEVKIHAFHILALKEVTYFGLRDDCVITYDYTVLNGRINSEWRFGKVVDGSGSNLLGLFRKNA